MNKGFKMEFFEDHIQVQIASDYKMEPDQQDEFWRVIRELCDKHNTRRVLVRGFVPKGERNTSDVIEAGMRTAAVPKLWIAFSLKNFEPNDRSELFEVIAARQGVRVKFFSEPETALNWLRVNAPS